MHWKFGMFLWGLLAVGGLLSNPIGAFIGSILPDSDHKNAPMGKILPLWTVFRHRGFTHTIWAMVLFTLLAYLTLGLAFAKGIFIGYFSHLMLDACTPSGVYWFGKRKAAR